MIIEVGQVISGRYRVDQFLGRGGMAEVYKVWDRERVVHLAMKVLHEDMSHDKIFLRRFQREAQTMAKLQHPYIVRFYGLEQDGGLVYLLMEYVEGKTLKEEIFQAEGPLTHERVVEIMGSVCSALTYAHSKGYVHCDIKPANIMIRKNGDVLLTDFGITRLAEGATATMVGAGTPAYMAPEQILGKDPTPQTDIYAIGITMYEMLSGGERPFTGEQARTSGTTSEKVRWEQLHLEPQALGRINPAIGQAVETVVMKCIEKDPDRRFGSATELLNIMTSIFASAQAKNVSTSFHKQYSYSDNKSRGDHRRFRDKYGNRRSYIPSALQNIPFWAYLLGGVFIITIIFAVNLVIRKPVSVDSPELVNIENANGVGDRSFLSAKVITSDNMNLVTNLLTLGKGTVNDVVLSPDGTLIAVASSEGIYLYDANSFNMIEFLESAVRLNTVAFSPNGDQIAGAGWFNENHETPIDIWNVTDGSLYRTLTGHNAAVQGLFYKDDVTIISTDDHCSIEIFGIGDASVVDVDLSTNWATCTYSPDYSMFAAVGVNYSISLYRTVDYSLINKFQAHDNLIQALQFSKDGTKLISSSWDGTIKFWRVEDGVLLNTLGGDLGYIYSLALSQDGRLLASGSAGSNKSISLWNLDTDSLLIKYSTEGGTVKSLCFSPDGSLLIGGTTYGFDSIMIWGVENGNVASIPDHTGTVDSLAFSPNGELLAGTNAQSVVLWGLNESSVLRTLNGDVNYCDVAFSPDGELLAGAGWIKIDIWRIDSGEIINTFKTTDESVCALDFSPDGLSLGFGTAKGNIYLLSSKDMKVIKKISADDNMITNVRFSPDGSRLASSSEDKTIRIWDVDSGNFIFDMDVPDVMDIGFTNNAAEIARMGWNGGVELYEVDGGASLKAFVGSGEGPCRGFSFSPDGSLFIKGCGEQVEMNNIFDREKIRNFRTHDMVFSVAYSPDGTLFATGTSGGVIQVWGVSDR